MRHGTLERYLRGTSLIHRLDPRLKVLAALAYVVVTTSTPARAWPAFLWLAALAGGAILLSRIPLVEALRRSAIALHPMLTTLIFPFLSSPARRYSSTQPAITGSTQRHSAHWRIRIEPALPA